jgi:peroxin-2
MNSDNFAAAQRRVLERRQLLEAETGARPIGQQRAPRQHAAALGKLPYPLRRLPESGLSLWGLIKGREGTRPAFRVGQVDAELLDEELLILLKSQVAEALKYFGVWAHALASGDLRVNGG